MYDNKKQELDRLEIFLDNRNEIAKHNQRYANKEVSYSTSTNEFSDLTDVEFLDMMTMSNLNASEIEYDVTFIGAANVMLPKFVDWRSKGAVTKVKSQGHCGSCWTFSATGALEGQQFRKTGKLVSLSEQNLLDCSQANGCKGGKKGHAFAYIKENGGIDTEKSYSYKGVEGKCHFDKNTVGAKCKGYTSIAKGDEMQLMNAVATVGPIAISICVRRSLRSYHRGVYYEPNCSFNKVNHAVLIVGYGTERGHDYWLVKNSWGKDWGNRGYIKMARNKKNNCGIATAAIYPLV